jgi:hypothetical protein
LRRLSIASVSRRHIRICRRPHGAFRYAQLWTRAQHSVAVRRHGSNEAASDSNLCVGASCFRIRRCAKRSRDQHRTRCGRVVDCAARALKQHAEELCSCRFIRGAARRFPLALAQGPGERSVPMRTRQNFRCNAQMLDITQNQRGININRRHLHHRSPRCHAHQCAAAWFAAPHSIDLHDAVLRSIVSAEIATAVDISSAVVSVKVGASSSAALVRLATAPRAGG